MLKKLLILTLLLAGTIAFAGSPDNTICADLEGAAHGLCTGASRIGCGTDTEKDSKACARIEENYFQLTNEFPPWLPECPCWTSDELDALRYPNDSILGEVRYCTNGGHGGAVFEWTIYFYDNYTNAYRTNVSAEQYITRLGFPEVFHCKLKDTCGADAPGGCTNTDRDLPISKEEYVRCAVDIIESGFERELDCIPIPPLIIR